MSHVLNLIEKQLAMSNVRNRLAETPSRPGQYVAEDGTAFGPCLLISRECGSGGTLLAQKAGAMLGWNVFDSQIVDEIASSARVHQRLVESVDERIRSAWEQTWREFLPDDLGEARYLRHLKEVALALAHHGNVVIVGRGAQYFLPPQCSVRVRLIAPLEMRVKWLSERRALSPEESRLKIAEADKARAGFTWKSFRKDVGAPVNHDIVINMAGISMESAVRIVLAMIHEKLGVTVPVTGGNRQPSVAATERAGGGKAEPDYIYS